MTHPSWPPPPGGPPAGALPGCVRHPDRPTGLRCSRCDRPACPECLREASVGYQCVDCVREGQRGVRRPRTAARAGWSRRPAKPLVTLVLVALNLMVFAVTAVQAGSIAHNAASPLFDAWALVPVAVQDGEWWRLVTAGFLHIGPLHIVLNMLALYIIGRDVEAVLGRGRFLAVYLVSLLGGAVAVLLFGAATEAVAGASGAIYGLLGALAVLLRRMRLSLGPAIALIAANLVLSVTLPGISLLGHVGGLVVGAVATAGIVYAPARSRTAWQVGTVAGLSVLLVVAAAVAIGAG